MSGGEKGNGASKLELSPDGKSIKEIWKNTNVLYTYYVRAPETAGVDAQKTNGVLYMLNAEFNYDSNALNPLETKKLVFTSPVPTSAAQHLAEFHHEEIARNWNEPAKTTYSIPASGFTVLSKYGKCNTVKAVFSHSGFEYSWSGAGYEVQKPTVTVQFTNASNQQATFSFSLNADPQGAATFTGEKVMADSFFNQVIKTGLCE